MLAISPNAEADPAAGASFWRCEVRVRAERTGATSHGCLRRQIPGRCVATVGPSAGPDTGRALTEEWSVMSKLVRPRFRTSVVPAIVLMLAAVPGTASAASIVAGPPKEVASPTAQFTFASELQGATFECRLDSGAAAACSSPLALADVADGPHTFTVAAIDRAGNRDEMPASWSWVVDTQGPVVTIHKKDEVPGGMSATFDFTSEPDATFTCQLDDGKSAACTSPISWSGLPDGSHKVTVRGWDHLGSAGPPALATWTVDSTPPDTTITTGPSGDVTGTAATFAFTSTKPGSTFECALDSAAFERCSSPWTLSKLGGGVHRWRVRASSGGAVDPTPATRTWTVDAQGPVITLHGGPAEGSRSGSTTATIRMAAPESGVTFVCALDGKPMSCTAREAGTGLATGKRQHKPVTFARESMSGLATGRRTFTVYGVDQYGNAGPPATRTWTVLARGK